MREVKEPESSIKLNRFEELVGQISPKWAALRLANKASLEASRIMLSYGAAYPSIYRQQAWGPLVTEEAELQGFSRFQLMLDSRDLYRNFPIVRAAVNGVARRAVASGIHPQFSTEDVEWNHECLRQWKNWTEICDLAGAIDLDGICRQAIRSTYTDGDLGVGLVDKDGDLRLQLVEGDRIAENQRAGIQIDTWNPIGGVYVDWETGRPISYLVGKRGMGGILNTDNVYDQWPAESFIMLFRRQRVDQVRGVPLLAPVIQTARDLDRYITATRIQANVAATFGVVIKRAAAAQIMMNGTEQVRNGPTNARLNKFQMGQFSYLNPGEEIDSFHSSIPGPAFDQFSKFLVGLLAVGMGTTYAAIMNDFTNMSFSSSKAHFMDIEMCRKEWQRWLIRNLLYRVYCVWVSKRMTSGMLPWNVDAFDGIKWQGPAAIYTDPIDEATNTGLRLQYGTTTFQDVYTDQESDWRVKLEDRAKAAAYIGELAKKYNVDKSAISNVLPPGVDPDNDEGDEGKKVDKKKDSD